MGDDYITVLSNVAEFVLRFKFIVDTCIIQIQLKCCNDNDSHKFENSCAKCSFKDTMNVWSMLWCRLCGTSEWVTGCGSRCYKPDTSSQGNVNWSFMATATPTRTIFSEWSELGDRGQSPETATHPCIAGRSGRLTQSAMADHAAVNVRRSFITRASCLEKPGKQWHGSKHRSVETAGDHIDHRHHGMSQLSSYPRAITGPTVTPQRPVHKSVTSLGRHVVGLFI